MPIWYLLLPMEQTSPGAGKKTPTTPSLDPRPSLLLRNKMGGGKEEDGLGNRLGILVANGISHLCVNETAE